MHKENPFVSLQIEISQVSRFDFFYILVDTTKHELIL